MRHLKHILAIVVPLVVAGASSIAVSPAAQDFAANHAALAAYIIVGAGVLRAIYKAFQGETGSSSPTPVAGPGSSSMSAK